MKLVTLRQPVYIQIGKSARPIQANAFKALEKIGHGDRRYEVYEIEENGAWMVAEQVVAVVTINEAIIASTQEIG